MTTFSEILDAASSLSADEQQALLEIISRRLVDQNRARIVRDVQEARAEFADGRAITASVKEIMDEVKDEA